MEDVLQSEAESSLASCLTALLPVVSRGRRLLISPKFLPVVFFEETSQEQREEARAAIARKVDRQAAVHKMQTRVSEGASSWLLPRPASTTEPTRVAGPG